MKSCVNLINISIDDENNIMYYINPQTFLIIPPGVNLNEFINIVKCLPKIVMIETSSGVVDDSVMSLLEDD